MSRNKVSPQDKAVSRSFSLSGKVIDKLEEEAELKKKTVSSYLNELLKSHFNMQ